MPKHVGILGVSAEGAALCYRTICQEGPERLGPHGHPETTMHTFPFSEYVAYSEADDWLGLGDRLLDSVEKLRAAGADFVICPDNTVHQSIDLVRDRSPLPWLHIAEEVARVAAQRGLRRLLILGTRWLMSGPVYPAKLALLGIDCERPDEETMKNIDRIIWTELIKGRVEPKSLEYFQEVIRAHERRGCDGVVLGCTEIPLLITERSSPLAALDSTRLLARAALREAIRS